MNDKEENEISGYRNYDKFLEGYNTFSEYIIDGFKYIRLGEKGSKYHSDNETIEESKQKIGPFLAALIKGAADLQYVGERDFYHTNDDIEILFRIKKDYKDTPTKNRPSKLLKDVINLLEKENKQFIRIATTYEIRHI